MDDETAKYQHMASDDDDDDDFYGDQEEEYDYKVADGRNKTGEFGALGHHDNLAKTAELKTIGHLESFDEAKETLLQKGFESGYRETYTVSKSLGEQYGKMVTEMEFWGNHQDKSIASSDTTGSSTTDISRRLHQFLTKFQNRPMDKEFNGKESIELLQHELFRCKNES